MCGLVRGVGRQVEAAMELGRLDDAQRRASREKQRKPPRSIACCNAAIEHRDHSTREEAPTPVAPYAAEPNLTSGGAYGSSGRARWRLKPLSPMPRC